MLNLKRYAWIAKRFNRIKVFVSFMLVLWYIFLVITIKGQVREGRKVGRTIGYPTINLQYDGADRGIFVGAVLVKGMWQLAAIHLGPRPTFDEEEAVCEAFLLDWVDVIDPGEDVEIRVYDKIRDIKKFDNLDELAKAISEDVKFIRGWYNSENKRKLCS